MRRRLTSFLFFSVMAFACAPARAEKRWMDDPSPDTAIRVKELPSSDEDKLGIIQEGDAVDVLQTSTYTSVINDEKDYWYRIKTPSGKIGWIFGAYLQFPAPDPEDQKSVKRPIPPEFRRGALKKNPVFARLFPIRDHPTDFLLQGTFAKGARVLLFETKRSSACLAETGENFLYEGPGGPATDVTWLTARPECARPRDYFLARAGGAATALYEPLGLTLVRDEKTVQRMDAAVQKSGVLEKLLRDRPERFSRDGEDLPRVEKFPFQKGEIHFVTYKLKSEGAGPSQIAVVIHHRRPSEKFAIGPCAYIDKVFSVDGTHYMSVLHGQCKTDSWFWTLYRVDPQEFIQIYETYSY